MPSQLPEQGHVPAVAHPALGRFQDKRHIIPTVVAKQD